MAAIIFDIDGTIADSFDYVAEYLAGQAKLAPLNKVQREALRGASMPAMAKMLGFHWWDGPRLFLRGRRRMVQYVTALKTFPGIPELLEKLHNEGHELFIVSTNSVRNIKALLRHHKLEKYFLEIYGGASFFGKRPVLRNLLKEQNIEAKDAVYVCDEVRDVLASQSVGIRAVAVTWGFAKEGELRELRPAAVARNMAELTAILEEI